MHERVDEIGVGAVDDVSFLPQVNDGARVQFVMFVHLRSSLFFSFTKEVCACNSAKTGDSPKGAAEDVRLG
jgi:hypothetical protein